MTSLLRIILACLVLDQGIVFAQCCPAVVLASSLHKVRDDSRWCVTNPAEFKISAARNEYESFQVVVNRHNATITGINVTFLGNSLGDIVLNGDASKLLHRVAYIDIVTPSDCDGAPGRWPDALIPQRDPWFKEERLAFPARVAGENAAFWVDLFVDRKVPPGDYKAEVTVAFENRESELVNLSLRVFGFELESSNHHYKTSYGLSTEGILMAIYGKDWRHHKDEAVNLTQRYMDLGLMHRLSFTHHGLSDPALESSPIDWAGFNARWKAYLLTGKDLPFGLQSATFTTVQAPTSPELNAAFHANAQRHGWADKLVTKVCDEPANAAGWTECASTCAAVHALSPEARCEVTSTISQLQQDSNGTMKVSDVGTFTALINFVENSAQQCPGWPAWAYRNTRSDYDAWQAMNPSHEFWMYQSCMSEGCSSGINRSDGCPGGKPSSPCDAGWPSLMIDAPAIMNRVFPVMGYYYNASGELYWHTNYADTCTRENVIGNCPVDELPSAAWGMDPWKSQLIQGGNGDGQLTYPGHTDVIGGSTFIPIASIRLKLLRDGMEDHAYLRMLEKTHGRKVAMQQVKRVVSNAFTFTRDVDLWWHVREQIGDMIESGLHEIHWYV